MEKLNQFYATKLPIDQLMSITGGLNHETSWSSTSSSGAKRNGTDNIADGTTVTKYYIDGSLDPIDWMENSNDNHLL